MHHAAFEALGLDAVYAPFDVPPRQLANVLRGLSACRIDGVNVTVPHKTRIITALGRSLELSADAAQVGAVNTLVEKNDGFVGHNTDLEGIERTIAEELRLDLLGRHVLVLGAGGAARAVVWALIRLGAETVTLANRTSAKAQALRRQFAASASTTHLRVIEWDPRALQRAAADASLLINATSLGLRARDPLPIAPAALHRRLAVFDLVYRAPTTALVRAARRRGALAVDGVAMLVYQGAAAFRLWWQRPAPVPVMRRAVEQALRRRPR